jgi:hypothetical protein
MMDISNVQRKLRPWNYRAFDTETTRTVLVADEEREHLSAEQEALNRWRPYYKYSRYRQGMSICALLSSVRNAVFLVEGTMV